MLKKSGTKSKGKTCSLCVSNALYLMLEITILRLVKNHSGITPLKNGTCIDVTDFIVNLCFSNPFSSISDR